MISHEHKLIFIHIPKCAGTSIERFFGHFDGFEGRDGQDHRPMRMIESPPDWLAALRSRDGMKLLLKRQRHSRRRHTNPNNRVSITPAQFHRYYKFSIIRDPWARVYSWYRNVMNDPKHRARHGVGSDIALTEFVRRFGGRGMIAQADWWLKSFDGQIRLDRLILFNELGCGFAQVLRDLDRPEQPLARHHSGGGRVDLGRIYDAEARDLVARIYAAEIERFGFTFETAA